MNEEIEWTRDGVAALYRESRDAALARQNTLTKPPGSLGQLEEIALWLAERQGRVDPRLERVRISVFAADHGVAEEQVSAFPQAVTGEMIRNFATGGAAISVLAKSLGAQLEVVNLGVVNDPGEVPGVVQEQIAAQTANIARGAAMNEAQFGCALGSGKRAAERALGQGAQLFIGGDMGIANTTPCAATACAYLGMSPRELVGPGTGLDSSGVRHKEQVVARALAVNRAACTTPEGVLQSLGGFEIAALTGAMIRCAQLGMPVLVDGYIASTAALAATRISARVSDWLHCSHRSAEPGHAAILEALGGGGALLDLGMRLGEASGAATLVPLFRLACDLHNNMATFAEAGVSEGPGQ